MKRISASYLYTGKDLQVLENAYVDYAEDGTVLAVGTLGPGDDAGEHHEGILIPGMVNSHCHLELSHLRGQFVKGTGMSGFINQINALRDSRTREYKMEEAARWMDILWNQGVSAMGDISNCNDTFQLKSTCRMYTRTFLEVFGTEPDECGEIIEGVRKLKAEADALGIDAAPTPHSCYTMSPELVTASAAEGLEAGYLSYHSQESQEEEDLMISGTGALAENYRGRNMRTPPVTGKPALMYFMDRLRKVHEPPFKEHILLVHNVCLSQQAIDYALPMMEHAWWAVCPLSNIFIHNALPPLDLMRENGLAITLGTDSLSSNDDLDMVAEMYCIQKNFPDIPLGEIIRWATWNGAAFLSRTEELGSLEPGKKPGVVLITGISRDGRLQEGSRSSRII